MSTFSHILFVSALLCTAPLLDAQTMRFDFGSETTEPGYTAVTSQTTYSDALGYGFEPGTALTDVSRKKGSSLPATTSPPLNPSASASGCLKATTR